MVSVGQKLKMPKRCKKRFYDKKKNKFLKNKSHDIRVMATLELLCGKNRSYKHLILKKLEEFKNGQNWPRRKGYSLCKMVSLGKKLKMQKRCEKRFYDHFRVVMCKKLLLKTANTQKMTAFLNWPKLATTQRL